MPTLKVSRLPDRWQAADTEAGTRHLQHLNSCAVADPINPAGLIDGFPRCLGDYELLGELGKGGMGIVYRARQLSLNRLVALKVMRSDGFVSEAMRRRFRTEAETVAELNHPNIVAVFDTAEVEGHPCFSMEWVRGRTLAELAGETPLAPLQAARYLEKISRAVDHAHSRGILHRDLKPSNVLIDEHDEPRITDFGLAKHVGSDANLTLSRQLLGSPNFMAPEQAGAHRHSIGPHSDVYGLGATLFFLLTGRPPFHAESVTETLRQLTANEPASPRSLNSSVPRDLETLCLKCLDKEPQRRYHSAREVADELGRFLRGEPILARPVSATARLWRWSRRKPVLAGLLAGVAALTFVILTGAPLALVHIHRAQGRAEIAAAHNARLLYVADMNIAFQALRESRFARVRELLDRHRPQPGEPDLRSWEWGHLWHESNSDELATLPGDQRETQAIAYSSDGRCLAVAKHDGNAEIWDTTTRQLIVRLAHAAPVWNLAFTPDQRHLLTVTRTFPETAHRLRVWEISSGRELANAPVPAAPTYLAVAQDNRHLIIASEIDGSQRGQAGVDLFDLATLQPSVRLEDSLARDLGTASAQRAPILAVAKPDGITIWQVQQRTILHQIPLTAPTLRPTPHGPVLPMALSPDGTTLAAGDNSLHLFDLTQDAAPETTVSVPATVSCLAFSPDGTCLAAAHTDSTITLWHGPESSPWHLKGHRFPVTGLAFSPDGGTLASASTGDGIKFWSTSRPPDSWPVQSVPHDAVGASATAGTWMLWWTQDNQVEARKTDIPGTPAIRRQLPFPPKDTVHLSPQARYLCFIDPAGNIGVWETQTLEPVLTLPSTELEIPMFCFSPDETKLATFDLTTRTRVIWQLPEGREIARQDFDERKVAWHAWWGSDSRSYLVADSHSRGLWIWDVDQDVVRALLPHQASIWRAKMSDDHTLIATLDALGVVKLWDAQTQRELHTFPECGPVGFNTCYLIDISPDNRRLAVVNRDRELRLYDTATAQEITAITMPGLIGAGFSRDHEWLVLGTSTQFHYLPSAPLDQPTATPASPGFVATGSP